MKTKTVAISLMLTFTTCALFAQTDTIPKKDTIPNKKDTIHKTDGTGFLNRNVKENSTVKSIANYEKGLADPMYRQTAFATLPGIEDYRITSSKK